MFPTYDINYEEFIEFVTIFSNELGFTFNNYIVNTEEIKTSENNLVSCQPSSVG